MLLGAAAGAPSSGVCLGAAGDRFASEETEQSIIPADHDTFDDKLTNPR